MLQQRTIMINNRPTDAYRKQSALTATGVDLIVMLYDALKKNIILARRGIEKKNVTDSHNHLMKAQLIVTELINCLDMSYPISSELLALYDFMLENLKNANLRKEAEPLEPVLEMVNDLRAAWFEVSQGSRGSVELEEV
jgi:flagellar protein FliS